MKGDDKKAREIADANGPYVGAGSSLRPNVALAVAKGIKYGREQGFKEAVEAMRVSLSSLSAQSAQDQA